MTMQKKTIFLTGGTGFVGKAFVHTYCSTYNFILYVRNIGRARKKYASLLSEQNITFVTKIADCKDIIIDVVINLAGEPIAKPWTDKYKRTLYDSRVNLTSKITADFKIHKISPKIWINASAVGYYDLQVLKNMRANEYTENGDAFSASLCHDWEQQAFHAKKELLVNKLVIARFGVILDKTGGALAPMYNMAKYSKTTLDFGGGHGIVNWISLTDAVSFLHYSIENTLNKEIYNVVTSTSLTFSQLNKKIKHSCKGWLSLNMPNFVLNTLFGDMGNQLFKSKIDVESNLKDCSNFKLEHDDVLDLL